MKKEREGERTMLPLRDDTHNSFFDCTVHIFTFPHNQTQGRALLKHSLDAGAINQ